MSQKQLLVADWIMKNGLMIGNLTLYPKGSENILLNYSIGYLSGSDLYDNGLAVVAISICINNGG